MKINTVILGTTEYNHLRDFNNTYKKEGLIVNEDYRSAVYYTKDEGLKQLIEDLITSTNNVKDLKAQNSVLKSNLKYEKSRKGFWGFFKKLTKY